MAKTKTNKTGRKHAKVECSTCGKLVAYSSLKRHQGRRECAHTYLANTLAKQNAVPERHVFVWHYHLDNGVLPLLRKVGVALENAVIKPALLVDQAGCAQTGWHVPRWLSHLVRALDENNRNVYEAKRELQIVRERIERAAKDPLSKTRGKLFTADDARVIEARLVAASVALDARFDEAAVIYKHATDDDKYALEIEVELGVEAAKAVTSLAARLQAALAGC